MNLETVKAEQLPMTFVAAPGNLGNAENALKFITAGNAYFTVRSLKTGTRYTFHVRKSDDGKLYFVSLLTGPENTADYTYLGIIRNGGFKLTKASKMTKESGPVKAVEWILVYLFCHQMPPQTEIWHDGRCGRCGRMLTVPESIERGIGPDCAGRMQ